MKISQAMLRGSKIRHQCFETYFSGSSRVSGQSCAIGAAYEGLTGIWGENHVDVWQFIKYKSDTIDIEEFYFETTHAITSVHLAIVLLNDKKLWTREKIARWVAKNFEHQNSLAKTQVKHVWSRLFWDIRNNGGYKIDLEYSYLVDDWFEIVRNNNVNNK